MDFYIIYDPCAVATLLDVSRGVKFGCNALISFHVEILIIFDSAPQSIKNQFQDLVVEILCFLGSLREMELSKCFLFVVLFVYFDKYVLCLSIVFHLFYRA